MKYSKIFVVALLLILTILILNTWRRNVINSMHSSIKIEDVESIKIWGMAFSKGEILAKGEELIDIVKWFNSISDIRENANFQGTTEEAGIVIMLKSKEKILVIRSGRDFEVQRNNDKGKWISYWGKQNDIKKLLEEATGN